jgi:serine protease inhibitor
MSSKWTEKEINMIDEMVDEEIDNMDMEGLIQYATGSLWKWFDAKTPSQIKKMYEEYSNENISS